MFERIGQRSLSQPRHQMERRKEEGKPSTKFIIPR